MNEATQTQSDMILAALNGGRSLTAIDALNEFGCFRLAARVADLRGLGHQIETEFIEHDGKRFASYSLRRAA